MLVVFAQKIGTPSFGVVAKSLPEFGCPFDKEIDENPELKNSAIFGGI